MLEPRAQHLLKTLIERYVERRPAGRLARAVAPFGPRAVAGDDPQRDGGPRGDGLHREPAHVGRPRADREGLPLLRRQPHGHEAARDDGDPPPAKASSSRDRPQQLVSTAAGLLVAAHAVRRRGDDAAAAARPSFRHLEFLRLSERRVLLILVTAEGDVQNRILHTDRAYTSSQLDRSDQFLQPALCRPAVRRRSALRIATSCASSSEDIAPLMSAAVDAGEGALRGRRVAGRHRRAQPAQHRGLRVEHGAAAAAVRAVRAEDLDPAPARPVAARAGRADLHRRRVGPRRRSTTSASSPRRTSPTASRRHARRHRADAHGVRARHPDRRPHRQAPVQRDDAAAQ